MQSSEKTKKIHLGPLNLTKTNYKPYFGSLPNKRKKQNVTSLGPLQNIIIDIPQIQQTREPLQISAIEKLRLRIRKFFQQKPIKTKQQWQLYIRKSQIMQATNFGWTELQTFLLKIITDLFVQYKLTLQQNVDLLKFKEEYFENLSAQNSSILNKNKTDNKFNKTYNCNEYSINQYTNLNYTNLNKTKGSPKKTQFTKQSIYVNEQSLLNTTYRNNQKINEGGYHLQISKLQKEIDLYKQQIKKIQQDYKEKLRVMQKKIQFQLQYKYSETLQQKIKYQNQVESKKFYNDVLAQQFKLLKKKYQDLEQQDNSMKKHYLRLKQDKEKMNGLFQYKELWLMQYQQILQLNYRIKNIEAQKQAQITKNKGLKQKLKQVTKNFNYNYNISVDNQKEKQDLGKVLKEFRDWLKFFALPRVSKGMMNNNTFFPQMEIDSAKQNLTTLLPKDDPTNYKLLRPNFFIYFQAYEGIIMAQRKFPQRKVMPPSFYLTIRAILDAMFLHFNFTTDFKQFISFPEFVISFIQKFQINLQGKKPMLRKTPCQSQEKINFLLNVFNIEAANSWQCQIFRSFILEQMTLDQIYFYLDCRNRLLKGSQLNSSFGSSDATCFVKVNVAQQVVKDKLRNYDREMLQRMKKFIHSMKKIKYGKELIDLNFVLKLLLQVYSIEKIKSQRFFHHNFRSKSSSSKIPYTQYATFMTKNFDFLTKADIAKLYREMYTLSVSHITYKTIHHVCSIRGLFIPLLRKKMLTKVQLYKEPVYPKVFQDILYSDVQNSLNNLVEGLEQFGLQQILDSNISIHKFLHDCENMTLSKSFFYNKFIQQVQKILKIRQILTWKNQRSIIYQELTKDQIRQQLTNLLTLIHQGDDDLDSHKKWRETRAKAIEKLTRNFKIRIQESLAQFKIVDKKQYQIKIAQANQLSIENKKFLEGFRKQTRNNKNKLQQKQNHKIEGQEKQVEDKNN